MCLFCFWLILVIWFAFHSDLPTLSTLVNHWWHDCQALMHSPVVLIFDGPWKRVKSMANTTKNMQRTECSGVTLPEYFRFPRPCPQVFTQPISCIWICYFISKNKFLLPPLFFCSVSLMLFFFSLLCLKRGLETNYFLRASVSVTSIDRRDDMAPTRDCQFFQGDSLNQDFSFLRAFCLLKGKLRWPINGNWNPVFP